MKRKFLFLRINVEIKFPSKWTSIQYLMDYDVHYFNKPSKLCALKFQFMKCLKQFQVATSVDWNAFSNVL